MSTRHSFYGFNSTLYSLNTAMLRSWPTRCPLPCACALHGSHAHGVCCVPGKTERNAQRQRRPCLRTPLRLLCRLPSTPRLLPVSTTGRRHDGHAEACGARCHGRGTLAGTIRARGAASYGRGHGPGAACHARVPEHLSRACRRAWAWAGTRGAHAALGAETRNKRVPYSFPGCARSGMACQPTGPALPTHPLDNGVRHAVGYLRQGPSRLA
jgi:hypothetical protein